MRPGEDTCDADCSIGPEGGVLHSVECQYRKAGSVKVCPVCGEERHGGTCVDPEDAALAALKSELESCRSRLSTAEKERDVEIAARNYQWDKRKIAEKERDEARAGRDNWREACRKAEAERDSNDRYANAPLRRALLETLSRMKEPRLFCTRGHSHVLQLDCPEVFYADDMRGMPCSPAEAEGEWWLRVVALVLASPSAEDAPEAPKASEIASDSSAPEKALGALRAAEIRASYLEAMLRRVRFNIDYENFPAQEPLWQLVLAIDLALSGGAHVDVPKAQKEEK